MRALLPALLLLPVLSCAGPSTVDADASAAAGATADLADAPAAASGSATQEPVDAAPWAAPPLERLASAFDTASGERLTLQQLLDRLAAADVVFLGETHTDASTHRAELAVYEGMLARREGVVLAMEMFERDVQPRLDAYLNGEIDEAAFLASARPWGNYRTGYRPLVEAARAAGQPVVASNFPTPLRGAVARGGLEALDAARAENPGQVPEEILANTKEYHRRVDNAVRGHLEMMRAHGGGSEDGPRLTSTQTLWDNSMGDACARALDAYPGSQVVHVNGGFHSAYRDGTVRQLLLRKPDARVLTVAISPSDAPHAAEPSGVPSADFVLYVQRRETERTEGWWAVRSGRDLRYRLHMPDAAHAGAEVPLLLWLPADGLSAEDGMDLARALVGEGVAVAVFEAPYRETQPDLGVGGRWFWSDTFPDDLAVAGGGVAQAWAYLVREFPVDPGRTVLAGEGAGATVAATAALYAGDIPYRTLAFAPRSYERIKDMPLPLPEYADGPRPGAQSLTVVADGTAAEWWAPELDAYREVGLEAALLQPDAEPGRRDAQTATLLREALGVSAPAWSEGAATAWTQAEVDAARARHWVRLAALRHAAQAGAPVAVLGTGVDTDGMDMAPLDLGVSAEAYAEGRAQLPLCPGPFGGTTVLVLPDGMDAAEREAWRSYAGSEPLQKRSRFHRLRVADGAEALPDVLRTLIDEGRTNVLVLPAAFHVGGDAMRALARAVRPVEDALTLHWLPGLGGSR